MQITQTDIDSLHKHYLAARREYENAVREKNQNEEKLDKLYEVVKNAPARLLDMGVWGQKFDCGTSFCAAGWAASNPWFNRLGLTIEFDSLGGGEIRVYNRPTGFDGLADFFGISNLTADYLFDPVFYGDAPRYEIKKEVLKRIRMIKNKGEDAFREYVERKRKTSA